MRDFAALFSSLDETNKTNSKVAVLKAYFSTVAEEDRIYTLAMFTGRRPRRQISSTRMKEWAMELAAIPPWLFEESYQIVGDLSETISLLIPSSEGRAEKSLREWIVEINSLAGLDEAHKREWLLASWAQMNTQEIFVFNKILMGSFRVGVSQNLIVKALSELSGLETSVITHRIMGNWTPESLNFHDLLALEDSSDDISRPFPFYLAYSVQESSDKSKSASEIEEALGSPSLWLAEWKWDGIRSQVIKRQGKLFIWSRGEDLLSSKFPEMHPFIEDLPDGTVLDGEIVCFDNKPLPFNMLQTRIGRKNLTRKILDVSPVAFIAYDCLEFAGDDVRSAPLKERRLLLEQLQQRSAHPGVFRLSPIVDFSDWPQLFKLRQGARDMEAEGFMLKRKDSAYMTGRKRGDWWKWKVDPLSVDGVLIYAQRGHGRRAGLYTDYTFGVWHEGRLIAFAKAYSGLTDQEIRQVDNYVKRNTLEKFGPVRTVKPGLVFEIGFEGINASSRHKSGVALRFPRMLRWRKDKTVEDADTLDNLKALIAK